jgi:hypothetical protein
MVGEIIEFGTFRIDVDHQLLIEGSEGGLGRIPTGVLIQLILNRPKRVSKKELLKLVWGDSVGIHADADQNKVEVTIRQIRKKLGDDFRKPRFIRTDHDTYRWIYEPTKVISPSSAYKAVVIAESDLLVVRALTSAWNLETLLAAQAEKYCLIGRPFEWSDGILRAIDDGMLDMAIYNCERTDKYRHDNPDSKVERLGECCVSMDGESFYVLADGERWKEQRTVRQFRKRLFDGGGTIAVPKDSDMLETFLIAIGSTVSELRAHRVKIREIPGSDGLNVLARNPGILLIHGQNVRMQARYRNRSYGAGYVEVLNASVLRANTRKQLRRRAANCVVFRPDLLGEGSAMLLQSMVTAAMRNFHTNWQNGESSEALVQQLRVVPYWFGTRKNDEAEAVVREIVSKTYGFFNLLAKENTSSTDATHGTIA